MDSQQRGGIVLTSFDPVTADAVVTVLSRAGIAAWQDSATDASGDVIVRVLAGQRDIAMQAMGERMEEIQAEAVQAGSVRDHGAGQRHEIPASPRVTDPDDPSHGPPLMMERFADMRVLVVAILGPLLVVTIAGPFLPRQARAVLFILIAAGLVLALVRRRRQ